MTRVCFVGNSHVAAVKHGWDTVRSKYPNVDVDFFAVGHNAINDVRVENGSLIPTSKLSEKYFRMTSGGADRVILAEYDVVVVVGSLFSLRHVVHLYTAYRSEDHKNQEGSFNLISAAFFGEIATKRLASTIAIRLLDAIQRDTRGRVKVWLYPTPLPCESVLESSATKFAIPTIKEAVRWQDETSLFATFASATTELVREGRTIFSQPAHTRVRDMFTAREYSIGSVRINGIEHPEMDFDHMNERYGALVVEQILAHAMQ